MKIRFAAALLLLVLVPATVGVWGETPEDVLKDLQAAHGYVGLTGAVAVNGEILWSAGAGDADREAGVAAGPETVYRLGSVSKLLTIAAAALLMESGTLDVDAPVQQYVPEFPVYDGGAVTTRLLSAHLAGVPHYARLPKPDTMRPEYDDVVDALAEFMDREPVGPPGAQYQYSSYGYNLIGAVVERASGRPFPVYLQEAICAPLGMTRTRVERFGEDVPGLATFYIGRKDREPRLAPALKLSYKWPSGGMLSTAPDLVRFGSAWLPGAGFFKPETLETVFTPQTNLGDTTKIGMGWRISQDDAGRTAYHHGGAITGGRAFLMVRPDDGLVVAILANLLGRQQGDFWLPDALRLGDAVTAD